MRNIDVLNTNAAASEVAVTEGTCSEGCTSCCTCNADQTTEMVEMNLDFQPGRFVDNAGYMGVGMLGIFIVMGTLIIGTALLNKILNRKPKQ